MTDCMHLWSGVFQERALQFKEQPITREGLNHATFKSARVSPALIAHLCHSLAQNTGQETLEWGKWTQEADGEETACCTLHRLLFPTSQGGGPDLPSFTHLTGSANSVPTLWGPRVSPQIRTRFAGKDDGFLNVGTKGEE